MTETRYKCKAVTLLKKELPGSWVYHPSDKWVSGVPDIFVLFRGVFAAIELKVAKNPPSKLQVIVLSRIELAGGMAWICRDSATVDGMHQIRSVISAIKMRAAHTHVEKVDCERAIDKETHNG